MILTLLIRYKERNDKMAIRNIREIGEEVLTKKCKEVTEMTPRTRELIQDLSLIHI